MPEAVSCTLRTFPPQDTKHVAQELEVYLTRNNASLIIIFIYHFNIVNSLGPRTPSTWPRSWRYS